MVENSDLADYDERREAAQDACAESSGRDPREHPFGFFAYGDAPGGIGGGTGVFQWYDSRDALLTDIASHITYANPGPSSSDVTQVDAAVKKAVAEFSKTDQPLQNLIVILNPILRRYSQFEWIGTFDSLKSADGEFETRVAHFR